MRYSDKSLILILVLDAVTGCAALVEGGGIKAGVRQVQVQPDGAALMEGEGIKAGVRQVRVQPDGKVVDENTLAVGCTFNMMHMGSDPEAASTRTMDNNFEYAECIDKGGKSYYLEYDDTTRQFHPGDQLSILVAETTPPEHSGPHVVPPWTASNVPFYKVVDHSLLVSSVEERTMRKTNKEKHVSPLSDDDVNGLGGANLEEQGSGWFRRPSSSCKLNTTTDYDCNGDCKAECKRWSYTSHKCKNALKCQYKYKFGDWSLDQSCRCKPCWDESGKASSDEQVVQGEFGQYWERWHNWASHVTTCAPWLMPKNDDEVRKILQHASSKGYKVRPTGATHSAPPLVTDAKNRNVLVISLARYTAPGDWEYKLTESGGSAKVMVNAGWSQLDLYEKIRPNKNYFIPTNTAGYFFQLGGIVANTVHGGGYRRGFLHNHVTRMRVMTSNGTIKIIDAEDDLRYWRNSYGLLGLILGVEFELEARPQFQMFTKTRVLPKWDSQEFWKFMRIDAEMDDTGVTVPGTTGTRKALAGEFFVDLASDKVTMLVISNKANENATEPGYSTSAPTDVVQQYTDLKQGSVFRSDGRKENYGSSTRIDGVPSIVPYVGLNKILNAFNWLPIQNSLIKTTMLQIPKLVKKARDNLNDGHFAIKAPDTFIAAWFVKAENAFPAFEFLRKIQRDGKGFKWNQPGEFRWVRVTGKAVLEPVPPGMYFTSEVLGFPGTAKDRQEVFKEMKQVEDHWVNELGAVPHIGKLFAFENVGGEVKPFQHGKKTCQIYSTAQKTEFEAYRKIQDPIGMFNSGFGAQLLENC